MNQTETAVVEKNQTFQSLNPANRDVVWQGACSDAEDVYRAVAAAEQAFPAWSKLTLEDRITYIDAFQEKLTADKNIFAQLISEETGKPLWEAKTEVGAMLGKGAITIKAYQDRCAAKQSELAGAQSHVRFKAHGVVGVLGPFNLPGHLPNGHITPALLAGNTVVFKPSELTPGVGERLVKLWHEAGLPQGVLQCIQGAGETGAALAGHLNLKGLFFTGSFKTGQKLHRLFGGHPEKILALEMGGNNPLVVHDVSDVEAAAYLTIQSAYITSGQRCVCARRLIVPKGKEGDEFIDCLVAMIEKIKYGTWSDTPEPFMGTVISAQAADSLIKAQAILKEQGGKPMLVMKRKNEEPALLSPGLIDVTSIKQRSDVEIFGPLLQLIRVPNFESAISEANDTSYGLSAGLFSDDPKNYSIFLNRINAGIVNWNRQITGASSAAPFGGIGRSGNHRPSAYFAADYCAYPVASIESNELVMPDKPTPGIAL